MTIAIETGRFKPSVPYAFKCFTVTPDLFKKPHVRAYVASEAIRNYLFMAEIRLIALKHESSAHGVIRG